MAQLSRRGPDRSGYLSQDTIAALATMSGGAVAMIRVSGPAALEALDRMTVEGFAALLVPRKLVRSPLKDQKGTPLDDALVVKFVAPESFTGEDCVEFHIHGSAFVATRVLATLADLGIRQALPGEFSFRAVRNGKMALSQAEAVSDLIAASNQSAVTLALEKLSGTQAVLIGQIAEELRRLATLAEIGIDFADQDVDEVSLSRLQSQVGTLIEKLMTLKNSYSRGVKVQEGIEVAFVGLPNAGKSSLFNVLLGEERSIVSDIAGTTRDVVGERLSLQGKTGGVTLRLKDTAGLRHSSDQIEKTGVERSLKAAREAQLILLVVDASSPDATEMLWEQWLMLGQPRSKTLGVFTKRDLVDEPSIKKLRLLLDRFGVEAWLETSAQTGHGITDAAAGIVTFCERWIHREPGEVLLTRLDHVVAVEQSVENLERGRRASEIDLFASDLRQALQALSIVIGDTFPDDILNKIFSSFCIGK